MPVINPVKTVLLTEAEKSLNSHNYQADKRYEFDILYEFYVRKTDRF